MAKYSIEDTTLREIADAIRSKTDTTNRIPVSNFASEIEGISGGASGENKLASLVDGSLTEITAEDLSGVETIKDYVFQNCKSLVSAILHNGIHSIGSYAFDGCESLTRIVIPDSVTSIGKFAFRNCKSLTSVTIPDSVTSIDNGAFSYCSSLASVEIGDSVTSIGNSAFAGYTSIENLVIPDSVTSIGSYAFENCTKLVSVIVGNGVTSIGNSAFSGHMCLEYFDFSRHTFVPALGNTRALAGGLTNNFEIRVPSALYDEWIAATNWSHFADNIVAV